MTDAIPMDPKCPRCAGKHGIEVAGDGYEFDCKACGGHLICAIGDGGEMYPWNREDGTCGCVGEPHTCNDAEDEASARITEIERRELLCADEEFAKLRAEIEALRRELENVGKGQDRAEANEKALHAENVALRVALDEALDAWEAWSDEVDGVHAPDPKIAEYRKLVTP